MKLKEVSVNGRRIVLESEVDGTYRVSINHDTKLFGSYNEASEYFDSCLN